MKRYDEAPFELIGINHNDGEQTYREGLETHKVTWLSAYTPGEPFSPEKAHSTIEDYAIQYFPTYIVLDVDGTIAWRSGDSKNKHRSMDDAIEELVKIAQAKGGK